MTAGSGGLDAPTALEFGPDGNLYVTSEHTSEVKRYNGKTGAFIDTFAAGNGLSAPIGLIFRKSQTFGDLNNDGKSDLLFQNASTGAVSFWLMNGSSLTSVGSLWQGGNKDWKLVAPK